jgi:hypothetical protein
LKIRAIFPFLVLAVVACDRAEQGEDSDIDLAIGSVTGAEIRAHMEVLASDDMQGREAGTVGFQKAADYVAAQYRRIGLLPLGDAQSYFQSIDFFETRLDPESAHFVLHSGDGDTELVFRDDFIRSGSFGEAVEEVTAPLVFVGHGIAAPEYQHDDLAGIDVAGKILSP